MKLNFEINVANSMLELFTTSKRPNYSCEAKQKFSIQKIES